ncbi:NUDIX hydrolase [Streptomyces sp. NPDC005574]|uniref:NUDIX hydrolase n=1 Tax=Streptomyces sp. NPDC005574 TaxID=3156891 RepID=UPI0033AA154C
MPDTTPAADLAVLAPLARVITEAVHETPVRLGTRDGAVDLIQQLIIRTATYMGSELPATPGLARHMIDLDGERQQQLAKWGEQHHPDGTGGSGALYVADRYRSIVDQGLEDGSVTWRDVLLEEVFEALAEPDPARLRAELVQVSAVCAAWIADLDSRPSA